MKAAEIGEVHSPVICALAEVVGASHVSVTQTDRMSYARDMYPPAIMRVRAGEYESLPEIIVWPANEKELIIVIKIARDAGKTIVPFGAGSGVCGGALPPPNCVIVDMKRMNELIALDERSLTATFGAGIFGEHLERELATRGFTLGHFPSSIYCSTLGGYVATRSAGQLSAYYGKIEDMIVRFRFVTPDGVAHTIENSAVLPPAIDCAGLFVGSEGAMGFVTQATLRICRQPAARSFRGIYFKNVEQGLTAIRKTLQSGLSPVAVRLYDEFDTLLVGSSGKGESAFAGLSLIKFESLLKPILKRITNQGEAFLLARPMLLRQLEGYVPANCLLILSFEGEHEHIVNQQEAALAICIDEGGTDVGAAPGEKWWNNRYHVSYNQSKIYESGSFVDTMEVATTWKDVASLYFEVRKRLSQHVFIMAHFSHAYRSGCSIYFSLLGHAATLEKSLALHSQCWREAMQIILKHHATITHHHGIGLLKREWLPEELGEGMDLLRAAKRVLDPTNQFNPGRLGL